MRTMLFLSLIILVATIVCAQDNTTLKFPDDFKIGVATSAYQIEGAWNVSDKGVNVWDDFVHQSPSPISDKSNGDIACDSYHKYEEDVAILKNLGVDFYRLSLSWSRILPTGFANNVSKAGIQYYKNLLDNLIMQGIEPMVTIYHWDHPLVLEEMGGWLNELMVTWFADYARVVFRELGDRVKIFATINEATIFCVDGYGSGKYAPGKKIPERGPYMCMHNMLKAHAKVYRIYDSEFRKTQGGQIGLVLACNYFYPKYSNDTEASDIQYDFSCGWEANPVYSKTGDYPDVMKRRIAENSKLEGHPRSRLPEFTQAEIEDIRGSADFLGLNHYTSFLTEEAPKLENKTWYQDSGVITSYNDSWPETISPWLRVVPEGLGDLLRLIKTLYNNPLVYVLENGVGDDGSSRNDYQRIHYLHDYLRELLIAVNRDGCNVKAYAAWSFLDNFEWNDGYTMPFGLVYVDFQNSNRTRTLKLSYKWFQEIIRMRELLPPNYVENMV